MIALAVLFWIGLWALVAYRLDKPVLLPYPGAVFKALIALLRDKGFLSIVWGSFIHVTAGFLFALILGILLAVISSMSVWIETFLMPGVKLIKTVPVVSFIILLLFFVKPERIGLVISLLMVFPVVYENVRKGIAGTDRKLSEAAEVFRVPFLKRMSCMVIPAMIPYTAAACSAGLSLCWKAGIAAELIAQSPKSIGHELYYSKLYVDAESVFAWTIVIIAVSVLFEKIFLVLFRLVTSPFAVATFWSNKGRLVRYLFGMSIEEKGSAPDEDEPEDATAKTILPEEKQDTAAETGRNTAGKTDETGDATARKNPEESSAAEPLCKLEKVGKRYDGRSILSGIDLSLIPGTVTILSGPSGIGKTTLLRMIMGLAEPDEGSVVFGQRDNRKPILSAVFQENRLCEQLSAVNNVRIVPDAPGRDEIRILLRRAGISETDGKAVAAFSGGMKRRVAWCRALTVQSHILVLDEPFTGLDDEKKDCMITLLKERKSDNAIVIVTHNASEIKKIYDAFESVKTISIGAEKGKV